MKTMLIVFALTLVFVVSMVFIENRRQNGLNNVNLAYKQGLVNLGLDPNTDDSTTTKTTTDDEDEGFEVSISGAVINEGTYSVEEGSYLNDLIDLAGGLLDTADTTCFNEYYVLVSGDSIYIPTNEQTNKVSINDATIAELDELPGIGETLATRIVNYREENGEFKTLDQLRKVSGVGKTIFNKIREYITL